MADQFFFRPVWWRVFVVDVFRSLVAFAFTAVVLIPLFGSKVVPFLSAVFLGSLLGAAVRSRSHPRSRAIEVNANQVDGPTGWLSKRACIPLTEIDHTHGFGTSIARWIMGPQHLRSLRGDNISVDPLTFDSETYRRLKASLGL